MSASVVFQAARPRNSSGSHACLPTGRCMKVYFVIGMGTLIETGLQLTGLVSIQIVRSV